jgi:hypothetical protein
MACGTRAVGSATAQLFIFGDGQALRDGGCAHVREAVLFAHFGPPADLETNRTRRLHRWASTPGAPRPAASSPPVPATRGAAVLDSNDGRRVKLHPSDVVPDAVRPGGAHVWAGGTISPSARTHSSRRPPRPARSALRERGTDTSPCREALERHLGVLAAPLRCTRARRPGGSGVPRARRRCSPCAA